MAKNSISKISNAFSTGGGGVNFEQQIQAMFLLSLLIDGFCPAMNEQTKKVHFQAKHLGHDVDDLVVITYRNQSEGKMACQIKHSITATEKDKTFQEVICAAWNDFNKEDFDRDRDRISLVTAQISNKAQQSLRFLHVEAIGAIDAEAFMERIDVPVFSNNDNQKMLAAIKECISLAKGCEPTNEEVWKFCKAFILLLFDMDCAESVNCALSASLIKCNSPENPILVWSRLVEYAGQCNQAAASVSKENIDRNIRDLFSKNNIIQLPPDPITAIDLFIPTIALIGAWKEDNEFDRKMIEQISGMEYSEFEAKARTMLSQNSEYLQLMNGNWKVCHKEELLNQCKNKLFDDSIGKLLEAVESILRQKSKCVASKMPYFIPISGEYDNSLELRGNLVKSLCWVKKNLSELSQCNQEKIENNINIKKKEKGKNMKYTADTKPGMGDPYWYEWSVGQKYIIDMLNPDNEIKHVELQADVALGLDDVVITYMDGHKKFVQVKHTRANDTLTFGDLVTIDTSNVDANSHISLLGELAKSWNEEHSKYSTTDILLFSNRKKGKRIAHAGPQRSIKRPALNWFIDDLSKQLETVKKYNELVFPGYELAWEEWKKQLEYIPNDDKKLEFLKHLSISTDQEELEALGETLIEKLKNTFKTNDEIARLLFVRLDHALRKWTTSIRDSSIVSVEDVLRELSIEDDIISYNHDLIPSVPFFESRLSVVEDIEKALSCPQNRVVFLSGIPGTGKTNIISKLSGKRNSIVNIRYYAYEPIDPQKEYLPKDVSRRVDNSVFWNELFNQLRRQLLGKLSKYRVPVINNLLPQEQLRSEFFRIAAEYAQDENSLFIVAIDGIDHAARANVSENTFLSALPNPEYLPENVKIVIAGQPKEDYRNYPEWLFNNEMGYVKEIHVPSILKSDIYSLVLSERLEVDGEHLEKRVADYCDKIPDTVQLIKLGRKWWGCRVVCENPNRSFLRVLYKDWYNHKFDWEEAELGRIVLSASEPYCLLITPQLWTYNNGYLLNPPESFISSSSVEQKKQIHDILFEGVDDTETVLAGGIIDYTHKEEIFGFMVSYFSIPGLPSKYAAYCYERNSRLLLQSRPDFSEQEHYNITLHHNGIESFQGSNIMCGFSKISLDEFHWHINITVNGMRLFNEGGQEIGRFEYYYGQRGNMGNRYISNQPLLQRWVVSNDAVSKARCIVGCPNNIKINHAFDSVIRKYED